MVLTMAAVAANKGFAPERLTVQVEMTTDDSAREWACEFGCIQDALLTSELARLHRITHAAASRGHYWLYIGPAGATMCSVSCSPPFRLITMSTW
jgi:hypothetical protein